MSRKVVLMLVLVALSLLVAMPASAARGGRPGSAGVIYVRSQGLYFDTFGGPSLPQHGRFQQLFPGVGGNPAETEYGPGDHDFVGGRWWIDNDGVPGMTAGDTYFLCPLLGPGRTSP